VSKTAPASTCETQPAAVETLDDAWAAVLRYDFATALPIIQPLADQGNAQAQLMLALIHDVGKGVPQDYAEAMKWFRRAADQGDAMAQVSVGSAYEDGKGVPKDLAEAMKWYLRAADQGNALAQMTVGFAYRDGKGVPQDYVRAYMWFSLAAQNQPFAQVLANDMTPAQIAEAQKL
jgi:uncharacterized protein